MPTAHELFESIKFGWNAANYKAYLESPAGKKDIATVRLTIAEILYTEEEIARNNIQAIIQQEMISLEMTSEEVAEKDSKQKRQEITAYDKLLKGQAAQIRANLNTLKQSTNQAQHMLNNVVNLDTRLQKKIEQLDVQHKCNKIELIKESETLQESQSHITKEQYDKALSTFEKSLQNQGEKLGIAEQREAEAWLCEKEVQTLREKIDILKNDLKTLSPESTSYITMQQAIQHAETTASALELKAKDIRESSMDQKESASQSLKEIRTDEARWIMAGAQSGVELNDAEKEAQKSQKSRLNSAILAGIQLKPTRKNEEKEALERPKF